MTVVSYVFGDTLTGAIIDEIPLRGVSMTRAFGAGIFRGSFQLDMTGKSNHTLIQASRPGRSFVVCEFDGVPVWGGFVWVDTYQSQAKNAQLFCRAWEHYPEYRLIRSDFLNTDTEQRDIFVNLWNAMVADPQSIQFEIPALGFTEVVPKTLDIKSYEFKNFRSAIDSIANATDGFDWTIDTIRINNYYQKVLRLGYPTLGISDPDDGPVFDYPGSILNYWENDTLGESGTHIYGLGAGEGSTMLTSESIHQDLLDSGYPRFDRRINLKEVLDQSILDALTSRYATVRKPGTPIFTVETKQDLDPQFGSYSLGDKTTLWLDDPKHPDPVDKQNITRIIGWELYPPQSDNVGTARLVFEGGDFDV